MELACQNLLPQYLQLRGYSSSVPLQTILASAIGHTRGVMSLQDLRSVGIHDRNVSYSVLTGFRYDELNLTAATARDAQKPWSPAIDM